MRKRAKVDRNQEAIVEALRFRGWLVLSLAPLGDGVPDLLLWHCGRGIMRLVEVKVPTGKLTKDQAGFALAGWPFQVVRSVEQALQL